LSEHLLLLVFLDLLVLLIGDLMPLNLVHDSRIGLSNAYGMRDYANKGYAVGQHIAENDATPLLYSDKQY
jgi:hypothetical protein